MALEARTHSRQNFPPTHIPNQEPLPNFVLSGPNPQFKVAKLSYVYVMS